MQSISFDHSIFVKPDGTVWACGSNNKGQLGTGDTANRLNPAQVTGISGGISAVLAGMNYSVILKSDGTVWSMGYNYNGQIGTGDTIDRYTPTQMPGMTNVKAIASGWGYTLMLKTDGTVWQAGGSGYSQLPIYSVKSIAAGYDGNGGSTAIFLESDGTVWGMGSNATGQLGTGSYGEILWITNPNTYIRCTSHNRRMSATLCI